MIPLVKVKLPPPEQLMPRLEEILYSGMIAEGDAVYEFERAFAAHFGLDHALAMSSGTAALHAALELAGVRPGDEVISTPMTAEPTNIAILHSGARIVWADVDPANGNIDPASVASAITSRTRAIMVVHYAGYPARMRELIDIGAAHGIPIIEDAAHALGARYDERPIGMLGDFSIFSLQAIKHMTTVDGGVLRLRDASQLEAARRFRWFGLTKGKPRLENDITTVGYKYNMNNVIATIGLQQLSVIDESIKLYRENGRAFDAALGALNHARPATFEAAADPSYWLYTLLCEDAPAVQAALEADGISASKLHVRNDRHSIFADSARRLPGLDEFYNRFLHLPCGWWVDTGTRDRIVEVVRAAAGAGD